MTQIISVRAGCAKMTCPSMGILLNIQLYVRIASEMVFIVTFILVQDKNCMRCLHKPFFSDKSIILSILN